MQFLKLYIHKLIKNTVNKFYIFVHNNFKKNEMRVIIIIIRLIIIVVYTNILKNYAARIY